MPTTRLLRQGPLAAIGGGILWLAASLFYLLTHGTSDVDQNGKLFGLTWYDGGKVLMPALVLLALSFVSAHQHHKIQTRTLGKVSFVIALVGFGLLALGVSFAFWSVPSGSYAQSDWDTPATRAGYIIALLSDLLLGIGLILYGLDVLRAKSLGQWRILPAGIGVLALVNLYLLGFSGIPFASAWIMFGVAMRAQGS